MGESSAKQQDEARARELYNGLTLMFANDNFHNGAADIAAITAAFAEVRRLQAERDARIADAAAEEAVARSKIYPTATLDGKETCARAIAERIRSLAPELPDQPGGKAGK